MRGADKLTREELLSKVNALIQEWRILLRLENWDIKAEVVEQDDINGNAAQAEWNLALRYAMIRVVDPENLDVDPLVKDVYELEKTILHEFAHVLLCPLWGIYQDLVDELSPSAQRVVSKQWDLANEQVVEQLAKTLFSLKGGDKDKSIRD